MRIFKSEQVQKYDYENWKDKKVPRAHHPASNMMPNGDPWDRFFYPNLTLMKSSNILDAISVTCNCSIFLFY